MKRVMIGMAVAVIFYTSFVASADIKLGQTLMQQKKYAEAREEFLKDMPNLKGKEAARIQLMIASTYNNEKKYAEARKEYEKVLEIEGATDGQKAQALLAIGRIVRTQEKNTDEARKYFSKVLELSGAGDDNKGSAQLEIAATYWEDKNYEQTIKEATKVTQIEGAAPLTKNRALLFIARGHKALKNYPEALKFYMDFSANETSPSYLAEAHLAIGEIYFLDKKYQNAREYLSKLLVDEKIPNAYKSAAHLFIARSYKEENNNVEALKEYKNLVEAPYVSASHKKEAEKTIKQIEGK